MQQRHIPLLMYDTIIVGAGIAGASAALVLGKQEKVLIVEAEQPASGASGVAGGLFSPMLALRGRPAWRALEAIEAFQRQLDETDGHALFDNRGVIRPAHDEQQAIYFQDSVALLPEEAEWLSPEASKVRYPLVHAPYGSMFVRRAGAVDLGAYTNHLVDAAKQKGVELMTEARVTQWGDTQNNAFVVVQTDQGEERLEAQRVLLCWGQMFLKAPPFAQLNLNRVKGQTIRASMPEGLSIENLIPVSGKGYVIPQADHLAIGSSYEHNYVTEGPTPEISQELLEKACYMVPALETSSIMSAQAGFRVTVPGVRKPVVGPLPGYDHIYAFSGFGSKGLLMAPLLSYELPDLLTPPIDIPPELRVRVKTS